MFRLRRSRFLRSTFQLSIFGGCLVLASQGCQQSSPSPGTTTLRNRDIDATQFWDDQISNVRDGQSTAISFLSAPVTQMQISQLLKGCDELTVLEIDHSELDFSRFLSVLERLTKLRQIRLEGPVDNKQLSSLATTLRSARVFNFPNASFDNSVLSELTDHQSLELFRFSSPNVDDDGVELITQIPNLRFLHLMEVPITDAGLVPIASAETLESFYLDGGECTEEGLSKLIKSRPDLHFHWNQLHLKSDPQNHPH